MQLHSLQSRKVEFLDEKSPNLEGLGFLDW